MARFEYAHFFSMKNDSFFGLLLRVAVVVTFFVSFSYGVTMDYENGNNTGYANATYLLKTLLTNYDIRLRPDFGERPLLLEMDVVIASFDSISEVNMDYTITMYLHQYWCDERLSWSKSRNDSMTLSGEFSAEIWVPDTFLANDKHSFLHDVTETNKMLRLHGDGFIAYGMRFTTTLACNMNLRYYPLDSQNCTVEIESYGYTTSEVFMAWRDGNNSIKGVMEAEIPQFTIVRYKAVDRIEKTSTGEYQRLSLVLILRRNIGYFIFQTYLPSILIVMLSWVSFWINHEATSARVALGITTVLTMTTISTGVRASLPRISYIKAIDIYLVMCFVFVFAALLEYAAVNYTYWGSKAKKKGKDGKILNRATTKEFPTWESFLSEKELEDDSDDETMRRRVLSNTSIGRVSPLPGLRTSYTHDSEFNMDIRTGEQQIGQMANQTDSINYPRTSFYSSVIDPNHHGLRYRGRTKFGTSIANVRRKKFVKSLRQRARAVRLVIPKIRDINVIDKWSRFIFPCSFILFNVVYWCYYIFVDWYGPPE